MELILTILFSALTVLVVLMTLAFAVVAVFFILIAKNIHQLFEAIKQEGEKIVGDIEQFRESAKSGGMKFASFALSVLSFLKHHGKKPKKEKS